MSRTFLVLATALVASLASTAALAGGPEPKESVALARSWEAAIEEAKLLNVPIVVHSHGFYCGPCWGMHSAVMCNKKYIDFADKNTVEVISLDRLEEGVEKGDKRAETYEVKVGDKVEKYLVEFPGLTVEDMVALQRSKAGQYNKTGKIPYTCLVNPWTEEEIQNWSGSAPVGDIEEAVTKAREALEASHGKGIARKEIRTLAEAEGDAAEKVAKSDWAGALGILAKVATKAKDWPEAMQTRLGAAKDKVVAAAGETLTSLETLAETDRTRAKSELGKIVSKLKGTGLEDKARALLATLSAPKSST